jgi:hypothetical protein
MWKDVSVARNLNGEPTAAAITAHKQAGHREQRAVFFQVSAAGGTCQFLMYFTFLCQFYRLYMSTKPTWAGRPTGSGRVSCA